MPGDRHDRCGNAVCRQGRGPPPTRSPATSASGSSGRWLPASPPADTGRRGFADLVELSGVSRRSFYDLYDGKPACFRATIEAMLSAGIEVALAAEAAGSSWEERATNRFGAFARLIAEQPAAARMCLIEAYAAPR